MATNCKFCGKRIRWDENSNAWTLADGDSGCEYNDSHRPLKEGETVGGGNRNPDPESQAPTAEQIVVELVKLRDHASKRKHEAFLEVGHRLIVLRALVLRTQQYDPEKLAHRNTRDVLRLETEATFRALIELEKLDWCAGTAQSALDAAKEISTP